ncbi:YgaP family membrane protein [Dyella silvae]|uniref:YgaP family membrane protein n=1 Tax=Dyella silvae TaxID=2994424 RepID=UPI0022642EA3|nr:DUF2892 domain-containing protein [Dyella silvae]
MSFVKTAFFVKNVPVLERIIRVLVAAAIVILGLAYLTSPWNWIAAIAGVGFGLTGVIGFCPACALVGRRLARSARANYL